MPEPRDSADALLDQLRSITTTDDILRRAAGIRQAEDFLAEAAPDIPTDDIRLEYARLLISVEHRDRAQEVYQLLLREPQSESTPARVLLAQIRELLAAGALDEAERQVSTLHGILAAAPSDVARECAVAAESDLLGAVVDDAWAEEMMREEADPARTSAWDRVLRHSAALRRVAQDDPREDVAVAMALSAFVIAVYRVSLADDDTGSPDRPPRGAALATADELYAQFATSTDPRVLAAIRDAEDEVRRLLVGDAPQVLAVTDRDLALPDDPATGFHARVLRDRIEAAIRLERRDDLDEAIGRLMAIAAEADAPASTEAIAVALLLTVRAADTAEVGTAFARFDDWMTRVPDHLRTPQVRRAHLSSWENVIDRLAAQSPPESTQDKGIGGTRVSADAGARPSAPLTSVERRYADEVGRLVGRYTSDPERDLRERAGRQLSDLAHHQRMREHYDDAASSYAAYVAHFRNTAVSSSFAEERASSGLNYGFLLLALLARPADAVAVYDDTIAAIGDPTSVRMRDLLSRLNASRQSALEVLYDRGDVAPDADPVGSEERARIRAAVEAGTALEAKGDWAGAQAQYDSIIDAHPHPVGPELRRRVLDALIRRGFTLGKQGRWAEVVEFYRDTLVRFGADEDMTVEKDVALGLVNLAGALDTLGRHEEEIAVYTQIIDRWKESPVPPLRVRAARAAWTRGITEADLGRLADADASYVLATRYLRDSDVATRLEGAKGGVNLAILRKKHAVGDYGVGVATAVVNALDEYHSPEARAQHAKALMAVARAEVQRGRTDAAREAYERLLQDSAVILTESQRDTLAQEYITLMGGPFKAAWARIRKSRRG